MEKVMLGAGLSSMRGLSEGTPWPYAKLTRVRGAQDDVCFPQQPGRQPALQERGEHHQ